MTRGILPDDLIKSLLDETGAYNGGQVSHLFGGITKPFDFAPKKRSEFSFGDFDEPLENLCAIAAKDFAAEFYHECQVIRRPLSMAEPKRYRYREESLCTLIKSDAFAEPVFVYFSYRTFFNIYNTYLGGATIASDKPVNQLSEVEHRVFEDLLRRWRGFLEVAIKELYGQTLTIDKLDATESDQRSFLGQEYLQAEYSYELGGALYPFAVMIPRVLIDLVRAKKDAEKVSAKGKTDPSWGKVVTDAVMHTVVDLVVRLGETRMNFADSVNLKVGDIVTWEKENTEVSVMMGGMQRMTGAIGVVDGGFAVRVDQVL